MIRPPASCLSPNWVCTASRRISPGSLGQHLGSADAQCFNFANAQYLEFFNNQYFDFHNAYHLDFANTQYLDLANTRALSPVQSGIEWYINNFLLEGLSDHTFLRSAVPSFSDPFRSAFRVG